jgi:mono/diheme cytochrome c family protein
MYKALAILAVISIFILNLYAGGCAAPAPPAATPAPPPATTPVTTAPPASPASTVETASAGELSDAGKVLFAQSCAACHGANGQGGGSPALTGPAASLAKYGNGQALFDFESTQMPLGKGGSLSRQAYLRLAVFLMVQNGFVSPSTVVSSDKLGDIKFTK